MLGEATFLLCAFELGEYDGQDNQIGRASDKKYTVILQRESDGGHAATVPAPPGCVSQGDTRAEVLKNIEEAIEFYLEDVRDAGEPIPVEADGEYGGVTNSLP
jgi:predicted RNase H-like HicB family nuclease